MRFPRHTRPAGAEVWPVAAVLAGAAVLRSVRLGSQSLWLDEAVSSDFVHLDLHRLLLAVRSNESTPPLYYMLAWGWSKVFGSSEIGVRSLSVALGVATVGATYLAARTLVGRRGALLASVFAALSPVLVWFSQEERAYELFAFLGACSFLFFARVLRGGRVVDLVGCSVTSALALTSHYFAAFLVAVEGTILLALPARRRRTMVALVPIVLVGVALLPLLHRQRQLAHANWIAVMPVDFRLLQLATWFATGHLRWVVGIAVSGAVVLAATWLLLTRSGGRERAGGGVALLVGLGTLALAGFASVVGFDYFLFRNVLHAWVPLAVAVAAGLTAQRSGRLGPALALVLCGLFLAGDIAVLVRRDLQRDDWRTVASLVSSQSGTALVVVYPYFEARPLIIYGRGAIECLGCAPGARVGQFGSVVGRYDSHIPVSVRDLWFVAVDPPFYSDYTGWPHARRLHFSPPPGFRRESVRVRQHFVVHHYTARSTVPVLIPPLTRSTGSAIPSRVLVVDERQVPRASPG